MQNIHSEISPAVGIAPAAARTTTTTGTGVDLSGYDAAEVILQPAAITDGVHTPTIEESDSSGSGYTTVAAGDMVGTLAALAANTIQRVAYKGIKRYLRVVITVTGGPATGGVYSAMVLRAHPRKQPTA